MAQISWNILIFLSRSVRRPNTIRASSRLVSSHHKWKWKWKWNPVAGPSIFRR